MKQTPSGARVETLAREFISLRAKKKAAEQEVEDIKAEMNQLSQEMVPLLQEMAAQSIKIAGLATVYLQTSFFVSAVKEQADNLVTWLDDHDLGCLAKRQIHHATLQAEYQKWADEDKPLPPPELVTAYPKIVARVRKA